MDIILLDTNITIVEGDFSKDEFYRCLRGDDTPPFSNNPTLDKVEKKSIKYVNTAKANRIIQYYENELQFWREQTIENEMNSEEKIYE